MSDIQTIQADRGFGSNINITESYKVIRCEKGVCRTCDHELIGEEPLMIRIEGNPYSVVMRTPGEEISHAAGFCLGEGLVDTRDDIATIGFCEDMDPNVVDIRLQPKSMARVSPLLERRGFVSQTSCGICGKEMVKDLYQILSPVTDHTRISIPQAFECMDRLSQHQDYYRRTRGSHAAMLFDSQFKMMAFAEDVGRHNALDKVIGKLFMAGKLAEARLAILSSRISYELVQKAARAHLPILISKSRPTSLAVEMAQGLNMTLACTAKEMELILICGEERITRE